MLFRSSAASATNASYASSATNATYASSAGSAGSATNASYASSATNATYASSSDAVVLSNVSTVNLVNYAVGTSIVAYLGSGSTGFAARSNRNATPTGAGYIVIAGNDTYNLGPSGSTALTGTWRARGYWAPYYSSTAYETYQIFTRTA